MTLSIENSNKTHKKRKHDVAERGKKLRGVRQESCKVVHVQHRQVIQNTVVQTVKQDNIKSRYFTEDTGKTK